jgi:hypothetical protein
MYGRKRNGSSHGSTRCGVCILGLKYVLNSDTGVTVSIVLRDMHFLIARYASLIKNVFTLVSGMGITPR